MLFRGRLTRAVVRVTAKCPRCHARPGKPCKRYGEEPKDQLHAERWDAARAVIWPGKHPDARSDDPPAVLMHAAQLIVRNGYPALEIARRQHKLDQISKLLVHGDPGKLWADRIKEVRRVLKS